MAFKQDPKTGVFYPVAETANSVNSFNPKTGVYTPVSAGVAALKATATPSTSGTFHATATAAPSMSQEELMSHIREAQASLAANGTVNGLTPTQNLAAVANQPGSGGVKATPYIKPDGSTDYHIPGVADNYTPNKAPEVKIKEGAGIDLSGGNGGSSGGSVGGGNSNPTNSLSDFKQSQTGLINDIYANQRAAQLQKIKETRDIQLQGLNKVNTQAEDSATAQRGQIAAADIQAGQRLRESMASMGILNSGDNLSAQGNLNTQRQSAMGQTNQELARVKQDVSERQKMINDAAASNDLALLQQLQAQQAQDMLTLGYKVNDNEYRDAVFGWQKQTDTAGLTGNFQNQRTIQGQQFDLNKTIDQRNFDYGASRDTVLDNRYNQQFDRSNFESDRSYELAKSGQEWGQLMQKQTFDFTKAQQIWDNNFKDKSFEQSMNEAAAGRGLQWASLSQRDKEFVADQAYKEKSFKADQEQRKLDNTFRNDQSANKPPSGSFNLDDFKGYINQNFYKDVPDPNKPWENIKQLDGAAARQYIIGRGLSDDQTDQLLKLYNLPTN